MKVKESSVNYCMRISEKLFQFLQKESKLRECSINQLLKTMVTEYKDTQANQDLKNAFSQIEPEEQDTEYGIHAQNEVIHER